MNVCLGLSLFITVDSGSWVPYLYSSNCRALCHWQTIQLSYFSFPYLRSDWLRWPSPPFSQSKYAILGESVWYISSLIIHYNINIIPLCSEAQYNILECYNVPSQSDKNIIYTMRNWITLTWQRSEFNFLEPFYLL